MLDISYCKFSYLLYYTNKACCMRMKDVAIAKVIQGHVFENLEIVFKGWKVSKEVEKGQNTYLFDFLPQNQPTLSNA